MSRPARWTRKVTERVETLLRERMAAGTTILIVTHSPEQAGRLGHQQVQMRDRRLGARMTPILLSPGDVAIAAVLIVVDAVLSLALRLGLHGQLVWAAMRMVVQLVLVGFVLRAVFAHRLAADYAGGGSRDGRDRRPRGGGAAGAAPRAVRQLCRRRAARSRSRRSSPPSWR